MSYFLKFLLFFYSFNFQKCSFCDLKFPYPLNLKQHVKKEHPDKKMCLNNAKNIFVSICDETRNRCRTYLLRLATIYVYRGVISATLFLPTDFI